MEWIRRNPKGAALLGVVSVAVVTVFSLLLFGGGPKPGAEPSTLGVPTTFPTDLATPATALPTALPSLTPSPGDSVQGTFNRALASFGHSGGDSSGSLNMAGLQGGSLSKTLPRHNLVLRVTSAAPIGTIGYVVPTSQNDYSGIVKNVRNFWSISTRVYGGPDYAQIYIQAGPRGTPITCTIIVDGRITKQQSTEGPYGQLLCQG